MIELADRLSGVGTYYFVEKLAQIAKMNEEGDEVINLGIGSPDLLPPSQVIERLQEVVQETDVNRYQSYRSIPALRKAFSDWYLTHFNVDLDPEKELLPLMGSKEGIMHIAMSFLGPGDRALVPDPGYPAYSSATELAGAEALVYPLEKGLNWRPDLKALDSMDLTSVKIMWLNYPNMPTGAQADLGFFDQLISFAERHDILLCHDNPYAFILNEEPLSILEVDGAIEHALELTSLSKCYNMAGWRIGCLAGNEDYINAVLKFKSNMDSGMFKGLQEAAVVALEHGKDWFSSLNEEYRKRRELAYRIMDSLGCIYQEDSAGLFVWAEIPSSRPSALEYSEEILMASKVFITPGIIFGQKGADHLRISLCSDIHILENAHQRIVNSFKAPEMNIEMNNARFYQNGKADQ
ncbi:MAG: aminotransferase class I/II-fold pyridoxal phosphate-dependent enzyme [Flavobacteriales bacterium]|nr:aminotransferase class I/II-fold pyridoxal phosphate-dependent enzyme [Flavobacteriales bacterium]